MSVYDSLGVTTIINASGPVTRLGGAGMSDTVLDAFQDAAREWVPIDQLQAAASKMIAQVTGAEAGLVTSGAAGSLTLGAAAIMARYDLARMEQLPNTTSMPHEFVIAREHRNGYDHAVRAAGAKLIEVGFNEVVAGAGVRCAEAWEYEAAFNERTAGVLYVYTASSQPALEAVVEVAHRRNLPVLVDAAGELPPRANLMLPGMTKADLVAFSGGKAISGPQSTGLLCGTRDLIASAALQMLDMDDHWELWEPPAEFIDRRKLKGMPRHGIGRAMKVSKEEIAALVTALAIFASEDPIDENEMHREHLQLIVEAVEGPTVRCHIVESLGDERVPLLEITLIAADAVEVCRGLRKGTPPIYVGHGKLSEGKLVINPMCLDRDAAETLARQFRKEHERCGTL
ncbi:MAG: selenocysteine synthase [Planctomycetaceae bacterium]|nr:selenocysteine synthase [Planctomycetales bacterium]MCB9925670.1 selenocysteine synthase [Planctomycetaceae bacterium]